MPGAGPALVSPTGGGESCKRVGHWHRCAFPVVSQLITADHVAELVPVTNRQRCFLVRNITPQHIPRDVKSTAQRKRSIFSIHSKGFALECQIAVALCDLKIVAKGTPKQLLVSVKAGIQQRLPRHGLQMIDVCQCCPGPAPLKLPLISVTPMCARTCLRHSGLGRAAVVDTIDFLTQEQRRGVPHEY